MERSNLGRGLRLYFLGQVFALISIEGMTLALIPLMAAVMNSAFQLERQWTVYMPYGAKEMEAMTLSPDVLVPYALLTLLLGIVMLVCDIVSLVALVKLRRGASPVPPCPVSDACGGGSSDSHRPAPVGGDLCVCGLAGHSVCRYSIFPSGNQRHPDPADGGAGSAVQHAGSPGPVVRGSM